MRNIVLTLAAVVALAGCTNPQPITNQPGSALLNTAENTPAGKVFIQDALDTGYNLNQAVTIGVLPATDLVVGCVNDELTKLGFDPATGAPLPGPAVKSFVPKIGGVGSFASVAYIDIHQFQQAGGLSIPDPSPACLAVIGWIHFQALKAAAQGGISLVAGPGLSSILNGLAGGGLGAVIGQLPKLP